ncbi:transforming acidic coiled-coil-containing protein 1 isoform X2 [Ornithorhynchus anatinus]|uniref:transforming acidic coiled-coil-containing protein 1 isoform X2 n=1 Tax=Ornithorhynchus anatinus TaxID=9258 RepID=UPI0010A92813|nr:transforming acidic coiled-coil-containing protein 1 isoform X2 [Ornithorhynchus anatinus]
MAFSPWQILSPVQWARWTWSAVRGGGEEEKEEDSQAETKSLSFSSDSEGNFETPEAETPIRSLEKELSDPSRALNGPRANTPELQEDDEQLIAEVSEKSLPETCPGPPKNEVQEHCPDPNSSQNFRVESDLEVGTISAVTPSSPEAERPEDIPAVEEHVTSTDESTGLQVGAMTTGVMVLPQRGPTDTELKTGPLISETGPCRSKLKKPKPISLRKKATAGEQPETEAVVEVPPLHKASYPFNPDNFDENTNPFGREDAKIQNSPPSAKKVPTTSSGGTDDSGVELQEDSGSSPLKMEFDFPEGAENPEAKAAPAKKLGRKLVSKLTPRRQKEGIGRPPCGEVTAGTTKEEVLPKGTSKLDPTQWDDPNFNSFGVKSTLQNSPPLPKGSYHFDPDNFDDSIDPFKPTNSLTNTEPADFCSNASHHVNEILDSQPYEVQGEDMKKGKASPKKAKSRLITSGCKVKKYESQSLVLDVHAQGDGAVISQAPDISNRDGHATDEEKLASTSSSQKPSRAEVKGEPEDDLEYFECSNVPVSTIHHAFSSSEAGLEKEPCRQMDKDGSSVSVVSDLHSLEKAPVSVACGGESPLDGICLSESDKMAVLTLIREEIITKEIEANEWKKKYEETRQEVLEMRKIVAEYEKTIAQMIEDEQRTNMTSQKSLQQLTMEKEQALADLNSVERSLSDLFRRYENLKGVLEGFKKNEEALKKCAQDYLTRVKQEEQRYQALKIHAEEKLDKANEEIAQVRTKAKAESVALHAGLRKEQMKVESLERALQQKNQEIEELTKICDELIAKLGKTD